MWICIPTQAWWGSPCVLNTYHPLTLIQVSRVWSHLIASMTSTARQCWTTPDHLFAEPCAQDPREGHRAAAPCVQGDRTCCMWNVESSAARPTDTVHPRLWDSGAQELLAREDLSRVSAWTAPLGSHTSMSLTAHEKAAWHLLSLSGVLLALNIVMLTKPRFQHGCLWTHVLSQVLRLLLVSLDLLTIDFSRSFIDLIIVIDHFKC